MIDAQLSHHVMCVLCIQMSWYISCLTCLRLGSLCIQYTVYVLVWAHCRFYWSGSLCQTLSSGLYCTIASIITPPPLSPLVMWYMSVIHPPTDIKSHPHHVTVSITWGVELRLSVTQTAASHEIQVSLKHNSTRAQRLSQIASLKLSGFKQQSPKIMWHFICNHLLLSQPTPHFFLNN